MNRAEFAKELKAEMNELFEEYAAEKSVELDKEVKPMRFSDKAARLVVDAFRNVILDAVANEEVKVFDGLTLTTRVREAHEAHNPATGEKVMVPDQRYPKAKFGKAFKEAVSLD